jgi:hypothetical protein
MVAELVWLVLMRTWLFSRTYKGIINCLNRRAYIDERKLVNGMGLLIILLIDHLPMNLRVGISGGVAE